MKCTKPFEERKNEASKILRDHPGYVPVIVEKDEKSKTLPDIDNCKFLVPDDLSFQLFVLIVRKRLPISARVSIFLFSNGKVPNMTSTLGDLYTELHDEDRFLYFTYIEETPFG